MKLTTILKSASLASGAALLASCGAVADNEAAMEQFGESCVTEFVGAGGPQEMAEGFCECSAGKVKEQELSAADMMDQEKMTAIGEQCATEMVQNATPS